MSSPTMMICLRKDRIGEGVSEGLAFSFILFLVGERGGGGRTDCIYYMYQVCTYLLVETGGGRVENGYKMLGNIFLRGV